MSFEKIKKVYGEKNRAFFSLMTHTNCDRISGKIECVAIFMDIHAK